MISTVPVSQQYLLASKARTKLLRCANAEKNKDYNLRVLVGHANLLDKLMDNIDKFNYKSRETSESFQVEYISSDDDSEDDERDYSSESSSEEEECEDEECEDEVDEDAGQQTFEYQPHTPRHSQPVHFPTIWEDEDQSRRPKKQYTPLNLIGSRLHSPSVPMVTVTIDQCLEERDYDDEDFESESEDSENVNEKEMEQDLSIMPMVLKHKETNADGTLTATQLLQHHQLDHHDLADVTPIAV